jgi:hypothetical protein
MASQMLFVKVCQKLTKVEARACRFIESVIFTTEHFQKMPFSNDYSLQNERFQRFDASALDLPLPLFRSCLVPTCLPVSAFRLQSL